MKRPPARAPCRGRFNAAFTAETRQRLDGHCATSGLVPRQVVETAVREYLDGTSDKKLLYRQYASVRRDLARLRREMQAHSQFMAEFVQHWLHNTQPLPPSDVQARKRHAVSAYERLLAATASGITGGKSFLNELPREIFSPETPELEASLGTGPSAAVAP